MFAIFVIDAVRFLFTDFLLFDLTFPLQVDFHGYDRKRFARSTVVPRRALRYSLWKMPLAADQMYGSLAKRPDSQARVQTESGIL